MIFLAVVATPVMNLIRPPSFQRQFARRMWQLAHRSMWIAVGILLATGLFGLYSRGMIGPQLLDKDFLLFNVTGRKLILTVFMVGLSLAHDLWLGPGARFRDPKASTDPPGLVAVVIPWVIAAGALTAVVLSLTYLRQ
jgi:hypothetical protein